MMGFSIFYTVPQFNLGQRIQETQLTPSMHSCLVKYPFAFCKIKKKCPSKRIVEEDFFLLT